MASEPIQYHLKVVGKWQAPDFQKLRAAAEFLATTRSNVKATIEGYFETQYEMRLKKIAHELGGPFFMAKPSNTLVYAIADEEKALYFSNMERFLEWAEKRFKYEDHTSMLVYKRLGNKSQQTNFAKNRRYCQISFQFGGKDKEEEPVCFELFHKECPRIVNNFLALVQSGKYLGAPGPLGVYAAWFGAFVESQYASTISSRMFRISGMPPCGFSSFQFSNEVKEDCYIQCGDTVDGSGINSVSASGEPVPDDSFKYKHDAAGLLGMVKSKLDTNGSQFYVTLKELPMCNGKTVIFGRVISGMRTMWKISRLQINYCGRPEKTVAISAMRPDLLDKSAPEVSAPKAAPAPPAPVADAGPPGETEEERLKREAAEEEAAATKVQSLYRGKQARASTTAKIDAKKQAEADAQAAQAEKERQEEEHAATRVQALYKGKKARAKVDEMKKVTHASTDANAASGSEEQS
eukprot:g2401.t1